MGSISTAMATLLRSMNSSWMGWAPAMGLKSAHFPIAALRASRVIWFPSEALLAAARAPIPNLSMVNVTVLLTNSTLVPAEADRERIFL